MEPTFYFTSLYLPVTLRDIHKSAYLRTPDMIVLFRIEYRIGCAVERVRTVRSAALTEYGMRKKKKGKILALWDVVIVRLPRQNCFLHFLHGGI